MPSGENCSASTPRSPRTLGGAHRVKTRYRGKYQLQVSTHKDLRIISAPQLMLAIVDEQVRDHIIEAGPLRNDPNALQYTATGFLMLWLSFGKRVVSPVGEWIRRRSASGDVGNLRSERSAFFRLGLLPKPLRIHDEGRPNVLRSRRREPRILSPSLIPFSDKQSTFATARLRSGFVR